MNQKVRASTLWRWHRVGKAGVHLEAARLPGGYVTSIEAIQRFVERLTDRLDSPLPATRPPWLKEERFHEPPVGV
jgi:hypothetical protein